MKRIMKLTLIFSVLAILLAGCSKASGSGSGSAGGTGETVKDFTFIVRSLGDPINFHPDAKSDDNAWPMNQNIFNRLVKLGPKDNVIADLAEDWEFSEDGLTLTFNLHEGVKWHDGEPFTSADVKWTYDTLIAESWRSSNTLTAIESIETPDDNTVVMKLKYADGALISKLAWYGTFIMPKHLYEGTDTATNPYNQNPVGTGPFKFVSWDKGVSVTLERNDDFFGDVPYMKTLIFSIISDDSTAYQALVNGEIDYMGTLPTAEVNSLDNDPNYTIIQQLGINRTYVTFNGANEHFSNPLVRQAVAYAVDQKSIYDRVGGAGQQAETFISPVFTDFVDENYKLPEVDVEKAMELLEQAGYTKDANGVYFEVELVLFESGNFKDIGTIIQANLAKAGIKVNLNVMEMAAWQTKVLENSDFEMTMLAGYQGPDVSGVSIRVQTGGTTNIMGYSNPVLDELLIAGSAETDLATRKEIYSQVQKIMSEDLPLILLIDNGYKYAIRNEFIGLPLQVSDQAASSEFTYVQKLAK